MVIIDIDMIVVPNLPRKPSMCKIVAVTHTLNDVGVHVEFELRLNEDKPVFLNLESDQAYGSKSISKVKVRVTEHTASETYHETATGKTVGTGIHPIYITKKVRDTDGMHVIAMDIPTTSICIQRYLRSLTQAKLELVEKSTRYLIQEIQG